MERHAQCSPLAPRWPEGRGELGRWAGLHGAARALAVAATAEAYPGLVVVVAADPLAASRLLDGLAFFAPGLARLPFPDWEILPYDQFSPYQDIISDRLLALSRLPDLKRGVLVVPVQTLMHRLCPRSFLFGHSFQLRRGERLDREPFRLRLEAGGYRAVSQVMEHGDFALRGSLIDLFPMGSSAPFRIDLFDDEIETIRTFDVETQISAESVPSIETLPAREFPLTEEGRNHFRAAFRARFAGRPTDSPLYQDISQGVAPAGVEFYLPLFFDRVETLFDYLPQEPLLLLDVGAEAATTRFWAEIGERHEEHRHDLHRPILPPEEVFLPPQALREQLAAFRRVEILPPGEAPKNAIHFATAAPVALPVDARAAEPYGEVRRFLDGFTGPAAGTPPGRVLFVAESAGRRETLLESFRKAGIATATVEDWPGFLSDLAPVALTVAPLQEGLILAHPALAVITEAQLFGERVTQQRRRRRGGARDPEAMVRDLTELSPGAPVVHEEHGVGRYIGLTTLELNGIQQEFILLEYAGADKLYVPVGALHLIDRFAGMDPEHAPLHKLGSGQWEKARKKAERRVTDVAAELLTIYAKREAERGHAFAFDEDAYRAFCQGFPFEETPDQAQAIEAVIADLRSERPMDRLICGDVGFGKTEVAMRAAFVAVEDGKQVAVLVPTTLLAQQHYQNFKDRFADWPVRIAQLSRFGSTKEAKLTLAELEAGQVDIVIGTHKLLQEDVRFKRLGLLIIDEEHRFGVKQKERFKAFRAQVDILTLTATPIPRTLNLAFSGIRDLSIIATAPARRLPIKTFVREWRDGLIREAILREIGRGGQVYFIHNSVETIDRMEATVAALVPEARVRHAHGQMREKDLERVMLDFFHQRFNVLICTTIVETGIDVPSANTIVIHRADRFGLAQIYQLRGRVGRSHHRAYAYLLVPPKGGMTADAVRRLEAIEALQDLGVGFSLASHDLEIRGAGEILGEEQSGHIQEVGFSLYNELLGRAVGALKAGLVPDFNPDPALGAEVELHIPVLLPADYVPDVHSRLLFYKRLADVADATALVYLREELVDRFGRLPPPAQNLFRVADFRRRAGVLGIRKVDLGSLGGRIVFRERPRFDPMALIRLIQAAPRVYRLDSEQRLLLRRDLPDAETRFAELETLISRFEAAPAGD